MSGTKTEGSTSHSSWPIIEHIGLTTLMSFIMLVLYFGGFHNPAPRDLHVGIVSGNPAVYAALEEGLHDSLGDGIHVHDFDDIDEAKRAVVDREVSGVYVPDAQNSKLFLASAASATTKETVVTIFHHVAEKQQSVLSIEDLVPVASNDPVGQSAFFFMIAMSVGSYATSIAIAAAGLHRRMRVRIGFAIASSIILPSLFILTARFGFDLFQGHFLQAWGLSILFCAAIHFIGVGLRPILGHYATLVYATVFVGLNFTSSGGAFSPELQYGFFRFLHEFWIGAGFIETMRNIEYFPGASIAPHMVVLAMWFIVGLACLTLGTVVERYRNRHPHPERPHELSEEIEEELDENFAPA